MIDYKKALANTFGYSSFNDEERQRKSILILMVGLTSIAGLIHSIIYVMLGVSQAIVAVLFYIGFSILNLILYYFNKNHNLFRNIQLVAILLFPTLTHIINGGFEQSSVVVLAAMLSPLGALMFHSSKAAKVFFYLFILMLFLSAIFDLAIPVSRIIIPKEIRVVFFFFDIAAITSISFFLLLKFVSDNELYKQLLKSKNIELSEEKKLVEETLNELKATQSQLIQSEKMASLGQLIAGIAHEINTPIGAINASIDSITDSTRQSIILLPDLVKSLSESELKLFMELVNRSVANKSIMTSKEERGFRKKIAAVLDEKGIAEADDFADILVDIGIYNEIEDYLPLFKPQTMQTAYHLSMQIKNSQNIKMAVDRAAKVVFALKNYAGDGNGQSMVEAKIIEGIETVLILYQNQLKHGITLHKEFEEVPSILCYPDELNQVWTNLIHNAIQAMEGKGELSISVSKNLTVSSDLSVFENQDIKNPKGFQNLWGLRVRITDTGKGIPPEIKDRIFDAFFTTKPAGEGSGLGLHIVKQIIDKHKGSITFESEVGKGSSFLVCFPSLGKPF